MRRYDKKKENTEKYWKQGMLDYETRWSCRIIDVCWGFSYNTSISFLFEAQKTFKPSLKAD